MIELTLKNKTIKKVMTRREIINSWIVQPEPMLNSPCCPNCRDLLDKDIDEHYFYSNCGFGEIK